MEWILVFFACLSITLLSYVFFLYQKYKELKNTFRNHKNSLRSVLKTINSVRYGNLYERVPQEAATLLPNIAESVNRMIESIVDREDMINEYQAELNNKIEALKEIEQLKEDFVATLTHDLKVPILAEKNLLNFLIENRFGELTQKQSEAIKHLKNSNQELVELVEILLETYKLNETNIILTKEELNIKKLLESLIDEMRPISDTDNISLNFYPHYDGNAMIDSFYIRRMMKNLILNAISFSNSGSKVDVSLEKYEDNIYIKITNYDKYIKKEELKHIFDKYYTTAKKFRKVGTGLGLYLSNKIAKAHKGDIYVDSEKDKYTTFTIKIPM